MQIIAKKTMLNLKQENPTQPSIPINASAVIIQSQCNPTKTKHRCHPWRVKNENMNALPLPFPYDGCMQKKKKIIRKISFPETKNNDIKRNVMVNAWYIS